MQASRSSVTIINAYTAIFGWAAFSVFFIDLGLRVKKISGS